MEVICTNRYHAHLLFRVQELFHVLAPQALEQFFGIGRRAVDVFGQNARVCAYALRMRPRAPGRPRLGNGAVEQSYVQPIGRNK